MKILIASYAFLPSMGGIEIFTELLANAFCARGHAVKIVTITPSGDFESHPFEVIRRPAPAEMLRLLRWCDVFVHNNISLRFAWPLLLVPRPWIVSIHSPLTGAKGLLRAKLFLKRTVLRLAHVVACSPGIALQLGHGTLFIPNPYRAALFRRLDDAPRPYDLVFLGRLVSDKGLDVLIRALAVLREGGHRPRLLVIGGGPEETALRAQCAALQVSEQVEFAGRLPNEDVVQRLNRCQIMVVPSVWEEPFPVVPLEGIACGCVVVASHAGGLPEGVGPCGVTFPKGDAAALAARITELLQDDEKIRAFRDQAARHLARHQPEAVAEAYLGVIERAFRARSGRRR